MKPVFILLTIFLLACNDTQREKEAITEKQMQIITWIKELDKMKTEFPNTALSFNITIDSLKFIYDSLEIELKKY